MDNTSYVAVLSIVPKPADRFDWLQTRWPNFNASDAATLYNAHPYKSLSDVVVEKSTRVADEAPNEDMERGTRLEPFLLEWYGDKVGVEIVTPDVLYVCGRLMATIDGIPVGDADWWVEAKTTRQRWDEPPPYVYWQVVAQAAASGRRIGVVVALDADMRLKTWELEPTQDEIADLLERVENFWSCLDLGMVPEGITFTSEQVAQLHPDPVGTVEADAELVARWLDAKDALKEAEEYEKSCRDALCNVIGEAEVVTVNGSPAVSWKAQTRTSLDTKALLADLPEAKKYERTTSYRTLRRING